MRVANLNSPKGGGVKLAVHKTVTCKVPKRAFAYRAAVAQKLASLFSGDLHLGTRNHGAREARSEQVATLVDGVALGCAKTQALHEFAPQIHDNHLRGSYGHRLLAYGFPVLFLANIG